MAVTGKNSLTLRKRDLDNEKTIAVGFTKLQAWHKADAGETGIDLLAMNFPPEVVNESNPSNAKLAKAQLRKYARNVTVTSTLSGKLMREISYTIPNATRINWVGFTAAQDEIFEITVDYSASTELTVVDGKPLVVTGTLASGQTDIVVGQPFEAGKFIDQQTGSVQVYIDGVQQFRNTNNQASPQDGNYYEVNVGGVSNLIRMNSTSGSDRDYLVMSNGVIAERPTVSQQADIEKVQGQVDAMIPDLAQATGNPETNYQAAPNNIDLKTFGDRVINLEKILNAEVPIVTGWTDGGTILIGATTTPPNKGTISTDKVSYFRKGDTGFFRYEYWQTTAGTTGTGNYLFSLPNSLQFDTAKVKVYAGTLAAAGANPEANSAMRGFGNIRETGTGDGDIQIVPYDSTRFRIWAHDHYVSAEVMDDNYYDLAIT